MFTSTHGPCTCVPSRVVRLDADYFTNVAFALGTNNDRRTFFQLHKGSTPSLQGSTLLDINRPSQDLLTRGERIFQMLRHKPSLCCQPAFEASYSIQYDRNQGLARGVGWIEGGRLTVAEKDAGMTNKAEHLFTTEWYPDPYHIPTATSFSQTGSTTHSEGFESAPTVGKQSTAQLNNHNTDTDKLPVLA